jgi:5-methylcytosine-specific restriction endonuclease McrA
MVQVQDPAARIFPPSYRDAAIRILLDQDPTGITCPGCNDRFIGRTRLKDLQADHIIPWAAGGETTWENMQLLCKSCNAIKSNKL